MVYDKPSVQECRWPNKLSEPPAVILSPIAGYCSNRDYLVVVFTRTSEPDVRESFRNTYGLLAEKFNFGILFPLGLASLGDINSNVSREHEIYGDILLSNFLDSYKNLTMKTLSYSNYVRINCTTVQAVVKFDDDMAWNAELLFDYLSNIGTKRELHCKTIVGGSAVRQKEHKWYMPEEEYPYRFYPEYCLGHVCAATPATISALVGAAHTTPHLWIDDVWSFGIVAWEAEVSFRQLEINRNTTFHEPFLNGRVAAQVLDSYEDGLPLFKAVHAKLLS